MQSPVFFIDKYRSSLITAGKAILLIGVLYVLVREILSSSQTYSFPPVSLSLSAAGLLTLILIGMPVNWFIESYKWRHLLKSFIPISIGTAVRATLNGVAVSTFMPNRVGESAGRILWLPEGSRTRGATTSAVTSFAQMNISVFAGLIALPFYLYTSQLVGGIYFIATASGTFILALTLFWAYFNLSRLLPGLRRLPAVHRRAVKVKECLDLITRRQLVTALLFSSLRYFIFTVQFAAILFLFGVKVPVLLVFCIIAVIYLTTTVVPAFTLAELGIRESAAVFLFAPFSADLPAVAVATFSLWIINIAIPAAAGAIVVVTRKSPGINTA